MEEIIYLWHKYQQQMTNCWTMALLSTCHLELAVFVGNPFKVITSFLTGQPLPINTWISVYSPVLTYLTTWESVEEASLRAQSPLVLLSLQQLHNITILAARCYVHWRLSLNNTWPLLINWLVKNFIHSIYVLPQSLWRSQADQSLHCSTALAIVLQIV